MMLWLKKQVCQVFGHHFVAMYDFGARRWINCHCRRCGKVYDWRDYARR